MTVHRRLETVWRMEFPALVAMVTRMVGDLGTAEDIVQDVSVIALDQWRRDGMPRDPAPWLRATAKHRAIDVLRRRRRTAAVVERAGLEDERRADHRPRATRSLAHPVTDDLLQLIFLTCHPALTRESQVALTLRLFGGLSSAEIARAFLVPEATVAQRISRAKRTLRDASARLELPAADQLPPRIAAVGEVVYLIFNEGYAATAGADWTRPDLCAEAIRLGRILTSLLPEESELHGLSALMQLHASRLPARIDAAGRPGAARRPGPAPLGPAADPPGTRGARPGDRTRRGPAPVRAAGVDRRLPRSRGSGRRDGLEPDHGALHGAGPRRAVADRRAQSGRRRRPVPRPRCGSGDRRRPAHRGGDLATYPQLRGRPRRPARARPADRRGHAAYRRAAELTRNQGSARSS